MDGEAKSGMRHVDDPSLHFVTSRPGNDWGGVSIERRGTKSGHNYQLLGHLLRGEVMVEPYLITLREGAQPHTSFAHQGSELIFMLEGEVSYRHGSETYHLRPGDTLLFDSGAQHGPEELFGQLTRYLSIIIYPRSAA